METTRKHSGNFTSKNCLFFAGTHHLKHSWLDTSKRHIVYHGLTEDNPRRLIESLLSEYLVKDARRGWVEWSYIDSHFTDDIISGHDELETLFRDLTDRWRRETGHLSSVTQIVLNQSYQQIIGLGSCVIPFLLAELRREPDHWFWALSAITREDPVNPENAGDVERMAEDWLAWGGKNGYISK